MRMEYERDFEIVDRLARIETKLDVLSDLQARVSVLEENANMNRGRDNTLIALVAIGAGIVGCLLTEVFGRLL